MDAALREGEDGADSVETQSASPRRAIWFLWKGLFWFLATVAFITCGPLGLILWGVFLTGNGQTPLPVGSVEILGHRGQPMRFPESSAEGYLNLPSGIVWEMDIQSPTANGTVYVAHDSIEEGYQTEYLTLDELLALADDRNATLLPEFKDVKWTNENIPAVARRLCDRSPWIQTFYWKTPGVISALREGCPSAKILCLAGFTSVPDLWGGPVPECDGEGRYWIDVIWVLLRRRLRGDTRPFGFFTLNSILPARAMNYLAGPTFGIFSDDAAGLLGYETDLKRSEFGNRFFAGFFWYSLFVWLVIGFLMSPLEPTFTPMLAWLQRWFLSSWWQTTVWAFLHLLVLYVDFQQRIVSMYFAFFTGAATGLVWVPVVYAVVVCHKRFAKPQEEAEMELTNV